MGSRAIELPCCAVKTAGGQAAVRERQPPQRLDCLARVFDGNLPSAAGKQLAAHFYQELGNRGIVEHLGDAISRVTLQQRSQVDLELWMDLAQGVIARIDN